MEIWFLLKRIASCTHMICVILRANNNRVHMKVGMITNDRSNKFMCNEFRMILGTDNLRIFHFQIPMMNQVAQI